MIIQELELIELCLLKDISTYDYESETLANPNDVDIPLLDQFE